jgi:hypothetical protein
VPPCALLNRPSPHEVPTPTRRQPHRQESAGRTGAYTSVVLEGRKTWVEGQELPGG